jgi:hypothetical protein
MTTKHRTEVTIETQRITVIRNADSRQQARCDSCSVSFGGMTVIQAALALKVDQQSIFRLLGADELHTLNPFDRMLLICVHSIEMYRSRELRHISNLIGD